MGHVPYHLYLYPKQCKACLSDCRSKLTGFTDQPWDGNGKTCQNSVCSNAEQKVQEARVIRNSCDRIAIWWWSESGMCQYWFNLQTWLVSFAISQGTTVFSPAPATEFPSKKLGMEEGGKKPELEWSQLERSGSKPAKRLGLSLSRETILSQHPKKDRSTPRLELPPAHPHQSLKASSLSDEKPFEAGRLKHFAQNWKRLTSDKFILNMMWGAEIPLENEGNVHSDEGHKSGPRKCTNRNGYWGRETVQYGRAW